MKTVTQFIAFDGTSFADEAECKAYEAARPELMLCGLSAAEVQSALDRSDEALANAFEDVGNRIRKLRIESGDLRRRGRQAAAESAVPLAPGSPGEAA